MRHTYFSHTFLMGTIIWSIQTTTAEKHQVASMDTLAGDCMLRHGHGATKDLLAYAATGDAIRILRECGAEVQPAPSAQPIERKQASGVIKFGLRNSSGTCFYNSYFQSLMVALEPSYANLKTIAQHIKPNRLTACFLDDWGNYRIQAMRRPQTFVRTLLPFAEAMASTRQTIITPYLSALCATWNEDIAPLRKYKDVPLIDFYTLASPLGELQSCDLEDHRVTILYMQEIRAITGLEGEYAFEKALGDAVARNKSVITLLSDRQISAAQIACRAATHTAGQAIPNYHVPLCLSGADEKQHYELQAVIYARFFDDINRIPVASPTDSALQDVRKMAALINQCSLLGRKDGYDDWIHHEAMIRHGDDGWRVVNDALVYDVCPTTSRPASWRTTFRMLQRCYPGRPCAFTYRRVDGPAPQEAPPFKYSAKEVPYTLKPLARPEDLDGDVDDGLMLSYPATRPMLCRELQVATDRSDYALHPQWAPQPPSSRPSVWRLTPEEHLTASIMQLPQMQQAPSQSGNRS